MNEKETEMIVSILNLCAETMDWNIDKEGFGYDPKTMDIMAGDSSLLDALRDLWIDIGGTKFWNDNDNKEHGRYGKN